LSIGDAEICWTKELEKALVDSLVYLTNKPVYHIKYNKMM